MKFYRFKVSYDSRSDGKKVTEQYLINAETFSEAEARAVQELEGIGYNIEITNISPLYYEDLIAEGGDMFYAAKVAYTTLNEKSGKEKVTNVKVLVNAEDFDKSYDAFRKYIQSGLSDYRIVSFTELPIVDIIKMQ